MLGYWQTVGLLWGMREYAQGAICFGLVLFFGLAGHLLLLLGAASVVSAFATFATF